MTTSAVASSLTRLARWRWARAARGLVGADAWGDTAQVDRLDQLYARSLREIEAHAGQMADMETGRYFIDEAAHLLAALRLWAQSQYRTEQAARDVLETLDAAALRDLAGRLGGMGGREAKTVSATLVAMARLPSAQLQAIAAYALRAL
jgi:hypothetical protein